MAEVASDQVATIVMIPMLVFTGLLMVQGFVLFHHADVRDRNWDEHLYLLRRRWAETLTGKINGRTAKPEEIEVEQSRIKDELSAILSPPSGVKDRLLDYSADFLIDAIYRSDNARFAEGVAYRTGIGRSFQRTLIKLQTVLDNAFSYALGGVAVLIVNKYAIAQENTLWSLISVFGALLAVISIYEITTGTLLEHIRMKMASEGLGPDSVIPKAAEEREKDKFVREEPSFAMPTAQVIEKEESDP